MPFTIRDDVPIRKTDQPLTLDDYEITDSVYAQGSLSRRAIAVRGQYKKEFLELWERVRQEYEESGRCSKMLMDQYEEAKANLIAANEVVEQIINKRT